MNCAPEDIDFSKCFFALAMSTALAPLAVCAHECGHALSFKLFFNNAAPKIKLDNYGFTGFCSPGIPMKDLKTSQLGKLIGHSRSLTITCAAGCLVQKSSTVALSFLFPKLANSTVSDLMIILYAISALSIKALYTGKKEDVRRSEQGDDFLIVRMHSGLFPTCVLITTLLGLSLLSIYKDVSC
ncbi:MAG: hypothetical protein H0X29_04330 [Parachlamydiaceae bacterium]|nr:hypothetical protein [Parachlamydiaceae bacterium]